MGEMQEFQPQQELQPKKETKEFEIPEQALQKIVEKYGITDPKDIRWILDLEQKEHSAVISKDNDVIRNDAIRLSGHHDALGNPNPRDPGFPNFSVSKETDPKNGAVEYKGYVYERIDSSIPLKPSYMTPEDAQRLFEMYMDIRRICEDFGIGKGSIEILPGYRPKNN